MAAEGPQGGVGGVIPAGRGDGEIRHPREKDRGIMKRSVYRKAKSMCCPTASSPTRGSSVAAAVDVWADFILIDNSLSSTLSISFACTTRGDYYSSSVHDLVEGTREAQGGDGGGVY